MTPGDVFVAQYSGGGGFGDPLTRAPERVARDIADRAHPAVRRPRSSTAW